MTLAVSVTSVRALDVPWSICDFCRRSLVLVERWGAAAIDEACPMKDFMSGFWLQAPASPAAKSMARCMSCGRHTLKGALSALADALLLEAPSSVKSEIEEVVMPHLASAPG